MTEWVWFGHERALKLICPSLASDPLPCLEWMRLAVPHTHTTFPFTLGPPSHLTYPHPTIIARLNAYTTMKLMDNMNEM